MRLIDGMTTKTYPFLENIDGRTYVNIENTGAPDVALLLLYEAYPEATSRVNLVESIQRHGHKANAAGMAINRMKNLLDDDNDMLKLRAIGRQKAEQLIEKLQVKRRVAR